MNRETWPGLRRVCWASNGTMDTRLSILSGISASNVPAQPVDEWSGARRLQPNHVPLLIMLQDVQPVGRYALQFTWSDGHDTGIYSYALLRRLCQCDICQPVKPVEPRSRRLL